MRAFVVAHEGDAATAGVRDVDDAEFLVDGDVEVAVRWSTLNFKDAMAVAPHSRVARRAVLIVGIDAAGTVVASESPSVGVGQEVIAHGHGFGTSHHGGLAERVRCPAAWLTPVPRGLDARSAMAYGTAGYTAMASVLALERTGLTNDRGPVLVTGATGGVGSVAVALLAARGFEVVAMTGKPDAHAFLTSLGARRVVARDALEDRPDRVLGAPTYAGAVDCVGGTTLAEILRVLRWGGAVAATGLVGGTALETTVYPFITRNAAVVGVDSVDAPAALRAEVWETLSCALDAGTIASIVTGEIGLDGVGAALEAIAHGQARGRVLVDPAREAAQVAP